MSGSGFFFPRQMLEFQHHEQRMEQSAEKHEAYMKQKDIELRRLEVEQRAYEEKLEKEQELAEEKHETAMAEEQAKQDALAGKNVDSVQSPQSPKTSTAEESANQDAPATTRYINEQVRLPRDESVQASTAPELRSGKAEGESGTDAKDRPKEDVQTTPVEQAASGGSGENKRIEGKKVHTLVGNEQNTKDLKQGEENIDPLMTGREQKVYDELSEKAEDGDMSDMSAIDRVAYDALAEKVLEDENSPFNETEKTAYEEISNKIFDGKDLNDTEQIAFKELNNKIDQAHEADNEGVLTDKDMIAYEALSIQIIEAGPSSLTATQREAFGALSDDIQKFWDKEDKPDDNKMSSAISRPTYNGDSTVKPELYF